MDHGMMREWESESWVRVLQEMHFLEWEPRGSPSNKMSVTESKELNGALYWYRCLTKFLEGDLCWVIFWPS